jgi:hypothetical protein
MEESNQQKIDTTTRFAFKGEVQIFDVENPWIYVSVPKKYSDKTKTLADRGLVAIKATVGKSTWDTSLMPKGDGSQFVPLPAKVRRVENIQVGDNIKLSFILRKR